MTTIWCLFSVENQYDQPPHNLVAWWAEKPDFSKIGHALGIKFSEANDESILAVVKLWQGNGVRYDNADYSLKSVPEGVLR